jgi:hypothetical protein
MADIATVRHMQHIAFHEVDASRWDDLERLFESRGGPKSCWCHGLESRGKNREGSRQESGDETIRLRRRPNRVAGLLQRGAWYSEHPRQMLIGDNAPVQDWLIEVGDPE